MIYNPEKPIDVQNAIEKIKYFIKCNKVFELRAKQTPKTYSQIKYAHLIISWFALEYGETKEYIKLEYFKKLVNPDVFEFEFINRKTGEIRTEYRSMANLTKDEYKFMDELVEAVDTLKSEVYEYLEGKQAPSKQLGMFDGDDDGDESSPL